MNPTATDAECLDVLRKAACDSLLARADRGLDTVIGEGGVKVSGGEKQRLSIARALLRRPHLLVFDEATSSLDSLTEEGIVDTIRDVAASGDAMTVLIAHRLSTILHADRIYVLERGRIVETGAPRRTGRAEGAVLRDVAPADRRAARRRSTGGDARCSQVASRQALVRNPLAISVWRMRIADFAERDHAHILILLVGRPGIEPGTP